MQLRKLKTDNIYETISYCYGQDPSLQEFSRNSECDLKTRIDLEFKSIIGNLTFFNVFDEDKLVGYYATETEPFPTLSTFFILPEYRDKKEKIFNYIIQDQPDIFYAGLFDVNIRAKRFFESIGGKIVMPVFVENKPGTLYVFRRLEC